jgi:hypothetical protein
MLAMVGAAIASHQLTPYAVVLTAAALAITGTSGLRGLPLIALLGALLWTAYVAAPYVEGHAAALESEIGAVSNILGQNVGGRLHGSPGHTTVVHLRLLATALLWGVAGVGLARRRRAGAPVLGLAAASLAAFPLLLVQSYGGEALLRVSLFATPFLAFLAASAFVDAERGRPSPRGWAALTLLAGALVVAFPITRYGNERMDYYTPEEISAVQRLYDIAPKGSVLVAASDALPWKYKAYAEYDYRLLTGLDRRDVVRDFAPRNDDVSIDIGSRNVRLLLQQVRTRMRVHPGQRSYFIVTRAQEADLDLMSPWRRHALADLVQVLERSGDFRVAFANREATIFELRQPSGS